MTSEQLAVVSNYALYGAMGMLALAMVAYAVFLGVARSQARIGHATGRVDDRVLVGASTTSEYNAPARPGATLGGGLAEGAAAGIDALGAPQAERTDARSGAVATTLAWLGTMLLLASIALRGVSVSRAPVSNMFEFAVAGAFLVMAVFLLLGMKRPLKWLGIFVVTPVLLILGLAITVWYTEASELVPSLKSTWLVIHVPVAILASALFTIAFVVLLIHLVKARHEARQAAAGRDAVPSLLDTLPSASALDRASYALHIAAFPLWTFTLIAGAIWGQQAWGTYWSWDPKEVWTFVIWVIYAAYLHSRATSGWSLRRSNVIAAVGYVAIVANFTIVNMYFPGMHSYSGL